ncbi:MAG TPA: membrane protein insertase YidC, partial [Patescibacteria group bacterium]|nr:membrane protein insertase YidC [Patescibacteria group bacterium]
PSYKDIADSRKEWLEVDNAKGWIGITEKYWWVALVPDPKMSFKARAVCKSGKDDCAGSLDRALNSAQFFQTDIRTDEFTVAPGSDASETTHVYAGVKNLDVMRAYQDKLGIDKLELGIDFGIYYLITKPFYYVLHFLFKWTGNVGLGILLMTILVRLCVFPLASKSFRSMAKMKIIAPRLKELQERYKDDKARLQMEIYDLYRKENANPFSGCWPIIVQIPIIFALYKVILISVDLRHAPFWGWIRDLSAPDPTSIFNLFGLIPWTPPSMLMIGAWPVLFCLTMVLQKRITPPMADAAQERLQTWFPYIATVMMAQFAVGLIIYWTWSNVLSTLQQYYILKKVGGENTSLIRGHADRRKKKG